MEWGFLARVHLNFQEAVVLPPYVAFAVRMNPGIWEYVKVHSEDLSVEGITPSEYLKFKETLYDEKWYAFLHQYNQSIVRLVTSINWNCVFRAKDDNSLEVDFGALDLSTPHLTLPSSIGNGLQFISKFLSSKLSDKPDSMKPLLDYLLTLNYRGEVRISHTRHSAKKIYII